MPTTLQLSAGLDTSAIFRQVEDVQRRLNSRKIQLNINSNASSALGNITGKTTDFNKALDAATARVVAFGAAAGAFNLVRKGVEELLRSTVEVEQALARINVNLNESQDGLKQFSKNIFDIARNTGQTFETAAKAAEELTRQGLTAKETTTRLKDALILSRLAAIDSAEAVNTLTASVNSFSKEALSSTEILNKLAAVDAKFAVSTKDLAEAVSRVGSSASEAGVNFNQLLAIVTSVQQTTARGGAVIGNALKTIFTRVERTNTLDDLEALGVGVRDLQGRALPAIQILKNLANTYDTLSQSQRALVAEQVGGVFQINILKAALGDLGKEYSVYQRALEVSAGATDEALRKNEALNKTLSSSFNDLRQSLTELFSEFGKVNLSPILRIVTEGLSSISKFLSGSKIGEDAGKSIGQNIMQGIGNVLTGPGAVALAAIMQSVISTLVRKVGAEFGDALSASLLNSGAIVGIGQAGKISQTRRVIPRAADGLIPSIAGESAAIGAGVGGASPNARPVIIPNFNFGGGKRGTVVANTSEYIVPNYANGGSAIFNPDMVRSMGLPHGAQKLAHGFIPNFANGLSRDIFDSIKYQNKGLVESLSEFTKQKISVLDSGYESLVLKAGKSVIKLPRGVRSAKYRGTFAEKAERGNNFNAISSSLGLDNFFSPRSRAVKIGDTPALVQQRVSGKTIKDALADIGDPYTLRNKKGFYVDEKITQDISDTFGYRALERGKVPYNKMPELDSTAKNFIIPSKDLKAFKEAVLSSQQTDSFPKLFKRFGVNVAAIDLAKGFIPNFATSQGDYFRSYFGLNSAISREKAAGVPLSSIYVDKDRRVASSTNPLGLLVANRQDEPAGGYQGVNRALSMGVNPAFHGLAKGYVPNFAISSKDALSLGAVNLRPGGSEGFIKGLDLSGVNFDVTERKVKEQIKKVIEKSLDINISELGPQPKRAYSKLVTEVLAVRQGDISNIKQTQVSNRNAEVEALQKAEFRKKLYGPKTYPIDPTPFQDINRSPDDKPWGNASYEGNYSFFGENKSFDVSRTKSDKIGRQKEAARLIALRREAAAQKEQKKQRFNDRALLGLSIISSFAAPTFENAIAGNAKGGEGRAITGGFVGGAFQGAGVGAIAGPQGAVIGAIVGGTIGAFSKLTKSIEEFNGEIEKGVNVQRNNIEGLTRAVAIQEQINEAEDPEVIKRLTKQLADILPELNDKTRARLEKGFSSEKERKEFVKSSVDEGGRNISILNAKQAINTLGEGGGFGQKIVRLTDKLSLNGINPIFGGLAPVISGSELTDESRAKSREAGAVIGQSLTKSRADALRKSSNLLARGSNEEGKISASDIAGLQGIFKNTLGSDQKVDATNFRELSLAVKQAVFSFDSSARVMKKIEQDLTSRVTLKNGNAFLGANFGQEGVFSSLGQTRTSPGNPYTSNAPGDKARAFLSVQNRLKELSAFGPEGDKSYEQALNNPNSKLGFVTNQAKAEAGQSNILDVARTFIGGFDKFKNTNLNDYNGAANKGLIKRILETQLKSSDTQESTTAEAILNALKVADINKKNFGLKDQETRDFEYRNKIEVRNPNNLTTTGYTAGGALPSKGRIFRNSSYAQPGDENDENLDVIKYFEERKKNAATYFQKNARVPGKGKDLDSGLVSGAETPTVTTDKKELKADINVNIGGTVIQDSKIIVDKITSAIADIITKGLESNSPSDQMVQSILLKLGVPIPKPIVPGKKADLDSGLIPGASIPLVKTR